jgi:hypothetical protein
MSLMFAASRLKICPKLLVTSWAGYVMQARSWYETGQLGISFVNAPAWVSHAFAVLDNATTAALDFKRENK